VKTTIRDFQKRYALSNRDMAEICQCSLPTIQKWRSGEVNVAGPARQLMRLLDYNAASDPARFREVIGKIADSVDVAPQETPPKGVGSDISAEELVDRLELLLESRRKDRKLAESQERYHSMLESLNLPVCRWLPDTTLTYVNRAYADLFSGIGGDLIGKKWIEFIPKERRPAVLTLISDVIRRGEPEGMVHESYDKQNNLRVQEWWDCPVLNDAGQVVELHSFGRDLTEMKHLQSRLTQLERIISRLLHLCDNPIIIFNDRGTILERNHSLQEQSPESAKTHQLSDVFPSISPKRFHRLLERLDQDDKLYVTVQNAKGTYKMRIRSLGAGPDGTRFLALLENEQDFHKKGVFTGDANAFGKRMPFPVSGKKGVEKAMDAIQHGLATKVPFMRAERGFIFLKNQGGWQMLAEWREDRLEPLQRSLPQIDADALPWWDKRMLRSELIQVDSVQRLPRTAKAEEAAFTRAGLGAIIAAPIQKGNKVVGFVALAQTGSGRMWDREEVSGLEALRDSLSAELQAASKRK